MPPRPHHPLLAAFLLTLASSPLLAADPKNKPLTDAQVVDSMHKAIDFLLAKQKDSNWETKPWQKEGQLGGETSLVLYALLHAAQSLQDDPAYAAKLNQRSPQIAASISWLLAINPHENYTAGLQASALALTTKKKDDKPFEGPVATLNRARDVLLNNMGADGGYEYGVIGGADGFNFFTGWKRYWDGKLANRDPKELENQKRFVADRLREMNAVFGGTEGVAQRFLKSLQDKAAKAKAEGNTKAAQLAEAEQKEFLLLLKGMPRPTSNANTNLTKNLVDARNAVARAEKQMATGGTKKVDKPGPNGKNVEVVVPKTKEDLQRDLDDAKKDLAAAEFEAKNRFDPIGDLSNAQYATLGAWALADYGVEIPTNYWQVQDRFWRLLQKSDGSWAYGTHNFSPSGAGTSTMGVAGIASLYITQEFVDTDLRLIPKPDKVLDAGLAWLNKDFKADSDDLYYMYGVERVGLASGLKYFGTTDWYREGAKNIIKRQGKNGNWESHGSENVGTAYALLFLARGRNPIIFNKLQYDGPWNARPRDSANITHWISKNLEKAINWQVVNLQVDPKEWLDAPILLITGSQPPKFTDADIAKLKTFTEAGGLIFSTADGNKTEFTDAIRKLAAQITSNKYEMRELPKNHPLFSAELWADVKTPPTILSLSNGTREIWIHSPTDLGASWHQRKVATTDHYTIPANLYFYATGKGTLRSKLAPLTITPSPEKTVRSLELARLDHVGNSDPEPGAWPRMAALAQANFHTDLKISTAKFTDLDPKKFPIAHITGTTRFTLNAADSLALKKYLTDGGILFADSSGGSQDFTDSFQQLMKTLFPADPLVQLPPDSIIYKGTLPESTVVNEIELRKYANIKLGRRVTAPALEGITLNNRLAVIFSSYDISSGFLGTNTYGILGYSPDSAQTLTRNILLYAAPKPPAENAPQKSAK